MKSDFSGKSQKINKFTRNWKLWIFREKSKNKQIQWNSPKTEISEFSGKSQEINKFTTNKRKTENRSNVDAYQFDAASSLKALNLERRALLI